MPGIRVCIREFVMLYFFKDILKSGLKSVRQISLSTWFLFIYYYFIYHDIFSIVSVDLFYINNFN